MSEIENQATEYSGERVDRDSHRSFEPVPLNPWASDYYKGQFDHIIDVVNRADFSFFPGDSSLLSSYVQQSALYALAKRMEEAHTTWSTYVDRSQDFSEYPPHSSPREALKFLASHPDLDSVELANMVHPANWGATWPMDEAIKRALKDIYHDEVILFEDPKDEGRSRITVKVQPHTPDKGKKFMIIPRKRIYAVAGSAGHTVEVIKRTSLLIKTYQGNAPDLPNVEPGLHQRLIDAIKIINEVAFHLSRLPKDKDTMEYIDGAEADHLVSVETPALQSATDIIDEILSIEDPLQRPYWIQPTATSYYAVQTIHHS